MLDHSAQEDIYRWAHAELEKAGWKRWNGVGFPHADEFVWPLLYNGDDPDYTYWMRLIVRIEAEGWQVRYGKGQWEIYRYEYSPTRGMCYANIAGRSSDPWAAVHQWLRTKEERCKRKSELYGT